MGKKKEFIVLILVLLFGSILFCDMCLAREQYRFHSKDNGYSIEIPKDWQTMPKSFVQKKFKELFAKPKDFFWEAGFQREGPDWKLRFPYTIVQVIRYSDSGMDRQLYKKEFKEFAEAAGGSKAKSMTSEDHRKFASGKFLDKVRLDAENKKFLYGLERYTSSYGSVTVQMVGYFGKHSIIEIMFYDLKSNWGKSAIERNTIFNSFKFDSLTAYDDALGGNNNIDSLTEHDDTLENNNSSLGKTVLKGVGNAIHKGITYGLAIIPILLIIGIFSLILYLIRSKKKGKDCINPKDDQNNSD